MTDKIDFSQLVQAEEGLISWEDLFPEYAVGGESFKSGQVHSKSFNTSSDQDDMTAVVSDDNVAVTAERFQEHVPVVEMSSLPDIPSFTEDDITWDDDGDLFSSEKTQQTTVAQPQTSTLDDSIFTMDGHTADSALSINEDWLERALSAVDGELAQRQKTVKDQDYWTHRFNEMNFAGMDLMAVSYFGSFTYDLFEQHMLLKRVTREFVRLLSYNYAMDLRSAGVSEEGIFYMKKGKIPENFTVHLKYPLEYGGTIDFNNMVFMQDKPFHDLIHSYLDEQMQTPSGISYPPLLYVPTPVGKIYVPFGMFTGSGGKNKQDRSVYAGFSKAAFDKIALKAMPGR